VPRAAGAVPPTSPQPAAARSHRPSPDRRASPITWSGARAPPAAQGRRRAHSRAIPPPGGGFNNHSDGTQRNRRGSTVSPDRPGTAGSSRQCPGTYTGTFVFQFSHTHGFSPLPGQAFVFREKQVASMPRQARTPTASRRDPDEHHPKAPQDTTGMPPEQG